MKSAERIKYFYETVISENQIERMAEFISPECCVKMGEKLIPVGIELKPLAVFGADVVIVVARGESDYC